jgi:hypothetical protein
MRAAAGIGASSYRASALSRSGGFQGDNWQARVRGLLKAELRKKGVSYPDLAA